MAGFRMHITTSTVLGVAYGGAAFSLFDAPLPTCVLAAGLCGVSGMLPDLDSGPGIPLRESLACGAAVVPLLLVDRFRHMGMSNELIALVGGLIYLSIRFGLGWALRNYTVHRGMFHSLPAAVIAGEAAFLVCATGDLNMRYFKAGAVVLGFMSHLLLDEIYSVSFHRGRIRLKSSFGTAVKFWGKSTWANVSTYAKLALLTLWVLNDPIWSDTPHGVGEMHEVATSLIDRVLR